MIQINRVSPRDTQHFFGYYDLPAFSPKGDYHLCHRVPFRDRLPEPGDVAELGRFQLSTGVFEPFASTKTWNFQQGAMLQWYGGSENTVFYNTLNESGNYVGCIHHIESGEKQIVDRPQANIDRAGKWGVSINFSRMFDFRPGYGYCQEPDSFASINQPKDDGIFITNLHAGTSELLCSYDELWEVLKSSYQDDNPKLLINHITYNPSGTRLVMIVRHFPLPGEQFQESSVLTMNRDGTDLKVHLKGCQASHYYWVNDETLLFWSDGPEGRQLYWIDDHTGRFEVIDRDFFRADGHCSVSPDGRWILYDSYPQKDGKQKLILYRIETKQGLILDRLAALPVSVTDIRCDLHPRWHLDSKTISIDSCYEGFRGLYTVDLSEVMETLIS